MTNLIQALQNSISKLLIHPLLWKLTGFCSSIVGFISYALSPSLAHLFGQFTPPKIVVYSIVSSLLSMSMLFIKRFNVGYGRRSVLLKAHVSFVVLTLTSLWSLFEYHSEEAWKVENEVGKMMNLTSTGAFALMAMSLSRQLQLGFKVGVSNFYLGCFLVTLMKMNFKLAPLAAFFCYLFVHVRSISDFSLEMHSYHTTCR